MKMKWLLLIAICLVFAGSSFGQKPRLTANVPFDFMANDVMFPKGEYIVSTFDDGRKLAIQNKNHPEYTSYLLNTEVSVSEYLDNDPRMIFIVTDGKHVLHQIACTGDRHIDDVVHEGGDVIKLAALR